MMALPSQTQAASLATTLNGDASLRGFRRPTGDKQDAAERPSEPCSAAPSALCRPVAAGTRWHLNCRMITAGSRPSVFSAPGRRAQRP
jgi:hypothetical protein